MSALLSQVKETFSRTLPPDFITAIVELKKSQTARRFLTDSAAHAELLMECVIGESAASDTIRICGGNWSSGSIET